MARLAAEITASGEPLPTVRGKAAELVSDRLWGGLTASWDAGSCREIAKAARAIERIKEKVHEEIGNVVADLAVPRVQDLPSRFCRAFITEFVEKIPLVPLDTKLDACALGLRLTGVAQCALRMRNLVDCACFHDLFLAKAKEVTSAEVAGTAQTWLSQVGA